MLERFWPINPCARRVGSIADILALSRTGLIDSKSSCWLVKFQSVESFNGCFCLDAYRHLDKGEAFRAASIMVTDDSH